MSLYRRGQTWWFVFQAGGRKIQESSGHQNKAAALRVEARRRTEILDRRVGFLETQTSTEVRRVHETIS